MTHLVFVGAPRSGASLIAEAMSGGEGWASTSLSTLDRPHLDGSGIADAAATWDPQVRHVDWSPRLSARATEVVRALPDAQFVWVVRRPLLVVSSLMEAWRSGRFVTEPGLEGWWGEPWSFPLIDQWRELIGAPLSVVCAAQWAALTDSLLDLLEETDAERWTLASFDDFILDPAAEIARISADLGTQWEGVLPDPLPVTASAVTPPDANVWQANAPEVMSALLAHEPTLRRMLEVAGERRPGFELPPLPEAPVDQGRTTLASDGTPFSSTHTTSMVELLQQTGTSLVISTYKSGHVIVARAGDERLDTEFTSMDRPMGIAVAGTRLAIGTADAIVTSTSVSGMTAQVAPERPDGCAYLPRSVTFTGDVAIHDMAYDADGVLHFVNTRFSCLCRQDIDYSFVPVWRPSWITALAAEDRCHLNGLAMVDGRPRYVTALARTDTADGWRDHKGTSGLVVDIATDAVVADGLSMPHSPRWHDGRLWVLQSGTGALATVDVATGEVTTVAELPGFTRGLSFIGPFALVGLSQVRETVFTSLPITQRAQERYCGVWVVDTRTGSVAGFLRFDGMVQEIFEVQVLPTPWPVIVDAGELTRNAFVLPDEVLAEVRESVG